MVWIAADRFSKLSVGRAYRHGPYGFVARENRPGVRLIAVTTDNRNALPDERSLCYVVEKVRFAARILNCETATGFDLAVFLREVYLM